MALRFALIAVWFVLASPGFAQDRIQVVTTTTDLRSLTEAVGGDRVAAVSLSFCRTWMPRSISPSRRTSCA